MRELKILNMNAIIFTIEAYTYITTIQCIA